MTPDQIVNGWNAVFVVAGVAALIAAWTQLKVFGNGRGVTLRHVWNSPESRMIAGFMLVTLGFTIRIGGWFPWRGMREAGRVDLVVWYADHAMWWTATGAVLCFMGLSLMFRPLLLHWFGRWAVVVMVTLMGVTYVIGAKGTWLHAIFLQN